ncbi:MAG TPA: efflux RND transporter periplasmic adaptor subunit [Thermoanaerobaculia bacterium]|jgi:RND family efflux transporter MFP subunit|nr:efflux RND transporter periplasmic adaptor subunit [Thermoanaerobaculia bacterium]
MRRRRLAPLLALTLFTPLAGCDRRQVTAEIPPAAAPHAAAPAPAAPSSLAAAPRQGWIGVVVSRQSVDVKADSQGRLQTVRVSIGDHVNKGDPIATLDTSLAAQDLSMARSELRSAQVDERRAGDEMAESLARNDRRQKNPDFFSKEDLAQASLQAKTVTAAHDVAVERVKQQTSKVQQLETSLSQNEIRAPFEGRVAQRFADPGAVVGPGTAVIRLISAGDLLVRAAVPTEEARKLKEGDPVAVAVRTVDLKIPGTVQRIAPEVDAASQMVLIEVHLNPTPEMESRLQTGLVVDVVPKAG